MPKQLTSCQMNTPLQIPQFFPCLSYPDLTALQKKNLSSISTKQNPLLLKNLRGRQWFSLTEANGPLHNDFYSRALLSL